jgi:hypothetical protein
MSLDGQGPQDDAPEIRAVPTEFAWLTSIGPAADGKVVVRNEIRNIHGSFVFFLPADGAIAMGEQLRKLGVQAKTGFIITGEIPEQRPEGN